ncbi:type II and III secretion system protein family protein [Limnohabitans sp. 2KL-3]|uniref:type II and III secretion system protein family protein n=1 Tax=Limnohabitans sp. 2KL-3 TaxID=1100700 RepID=UPI001892CA6B|nr:pilus assembly protein N-terminal domain-containing protein [Limnohabitans sp. 2KL-3]
MFKPAADASVKAESKAPVKRVTKATNEPQAKASDKKSARTAQTKALAQPVVVKSVLPANRLPVVLDIAAGRAHVLVLPFAASRVAVGNPQVADFTLVKNNELYILGKSVGATNLILWDKTGESRTVNLTVGVNLGVFADVLSRVLPQEKDIKLTSASGSIVLSGMVSDAIAADSVVNLAQAFLQQLQPGSGFGGQASALSSNPQAGSNNGSSTTPGGGANTAQAGALGNLSANAQRAQVINLMRIRDPQQVMLDVKIAEISKTLLDKLGVKGVERGDLMRWNIISNVVGGASDGSLGLLLGGGIAGKGTLLEAKKNDGLVKILAEPTIVAMSGHEGKFLVGGKVFIPITQNTGNSSSVALDEREFGVGLKFVPTVLDGGRISLRVASEVSEISKEPLVLSVGATTSILPAITTRNVSTTVQLRDSQSLVIGGLMRNNITESIKAFPLLGEIPILGALFRSTEFNSELTELIVVVSPRLVSATDKPPSLPTDNFTPPSRAQLLLEGKMEGSKPTEKLSNKK